MFTRDGLCNLMNEFGDKGYFFYSEGDFQFHLATRIQERYSDIYTVICEYPKKISGKNAKIDIILRTPQGVVPIELKYKLKLPHSIPDNDRYDFLRDVQRIEGLLSQQKKFGPIGYVLFLTNNPSFWDPHKKSNSNAAEFNMHEGCKISGTPTWWATKEKKKPHNKKPRLMIQGSYPIMWKKYSNNIVIPEDSSTQGGIFKYTVVEIN